ncbi:hypothetical protein BD779DRAFT_1502529 [Infundibulicybe gibba]|nr:hypothetical protein BD779DRAFT_1502529 [Infundibulicybe gibba]
MSHFTVEQPRPTMRRKSSAQNLLSSFKSGSSNSSTPAPLTIIPGTASSFATGLSFSAAGGATTPTATTAIGRDWDAQSLHSDTITPAGIGGATSPALGQGTSVEYLRDLVQKRIITLTYIRNVHEGRSHWFHTLLISRVELERVFNNSEMKKRTYRFAILGMSLSNLLDINQPQDLLRGLINTVTEYDQAKEDNEKTKMRASKRLFRPKNAKRQGAGSFTEYTGSYADATTDASYLVTPHMPFPLDYHQTLLSLLDVLSEVYNKISKLLGPSPISHSSQHMMGPLGLLSPHPGVSYLFSGESGALNSNQIPNQPPITIFPQAQYSANNASNPGDSEMSSSLWGIANAPTSGGTTAGAAAGSFIVGGTLGSPPSGITPNLAETILKIDSKFKKITSILLKELDAFARNGIKDELASLDPLLRNINVPDEEPSTNGILNTGGRVVYDFEGM